MTRWQSLTRSFGLLLSGQLYNDAIEGNVNDDALFDLTHHFPANEPKSSGDRVEFAHGQRRPAP